MKPTLVVSLVKTISVSIMTTVIIILTTSFAEAIDSEDLISMLPQYNEYDLNKNVHYFTPAQLVQNEYYFKEGDLYSVFDNQKAHFLSKQMLVVDPGGRIFIFGKRLFRTLHHSSATGGRRVFFPGEVEVKLGKIVTITNASGHYKPSLLALHNVLSYFLDRGADLRNTDVKLMSPADRFAFKRYGKAMRFLSDENNVGRYRINLCKNFFN